MKRHYRLYYLNHILQRINNWRAFRKEIKFWDRHLRLDNRDIWMEAVINPKTRKDRFPQLLLPYIEELRKVKDNLISILDVGSGPISELAWGVE